mgnify:CR=1 FL=1|tara:strand:+ start:541 stop:915 length:375 start_codon:yes stop_codon:yes gene_type:complete
MAVTTTTASNPLVTTVAVDGAADIVVESIDDGNNNVYAVEIINPNTSAVYIHMMNQAASSNSTTSTQHDHQLYCGAGSSCYYYWPEGYKTAAGIQVYCSDAAGGGQTASSPTEAVTLTFGFTAR